MSATEYDKRTYRVEDNRSLGDLFSELIDETRTLIRQEVALAKAEMQQKASQAGKSVAFMAVGGFIAYAGFLAIVAAAIIALAALIPWWLSALIVGIVVAIIGYALLRKGQNDLKELQVKPEQTVETLKENREWLKDQTR